MLLAMLFFGLAVGDALLLALLLATLFFLPAVGDALLLALLFAMLFFCLLLAMLFFFLLFAMLFLFFSSPRAARGKLPCSSRASSPLHVLRGEGRVSCLCRLHEAPAPRAAGTALRLVVSLRFRACACVSCPCGCLRALSFESCLRQYRLH